MKAALRPSDCIMMLPSAVPGDAAGSANALAKFLALIGTSLASFKAFRPRRKAKLYAGKSIFPMEGHKGVSDGLYYMHMWSCKPTSTDLLVLSCNYTAEEFFELVPEYVLHHPRHCSASRVRLLTTFLQLHSRRIL